MLKFEKKSVAKRLRMSEERVCRVIFGIKMEAIKGGWSKLHNEELQIDVLYHVFLE